MTSKSVDVEWLKVLLFVPVEDWPNPHPSAIVNTLIAPNLADGSTIVGTVASATVAVLNLSPLSTLALNLFT